MDIRLSILILIITTLLVSGGMVVNRGALPVNSATFIDKAAIHNLFEIRSGQLAASRAVNPDLRAFAAQMARHHESIDQQLRTAVIASGLDHRLPETLDEEHHVKLTTLDRFEGDSFDRRYISMIEEAHIAAIRLFKNYETKGNNEAVLTFVKETLPQLLEHQKDLNQVRSRLLE